MNKGKKIMTIGIIIAAFLASFIIFHLVKNSKANINVERRDSIVGQIENADLSVWDSKEREEVNKLNIYILGRLKKVKSDNEINEIVDMYNREISNIPDSATKKLVFKENLEKIQKLENSNDQKDIKYIINTENKDINMESFDDMEKYFKQIARRFKEARGKELEIPTSEQIEKSAKEKPSTHMIK